jgi:hypothetical protein
MRIAAIASGAAALLTMGAAAAVPSGPELWNGAQAGMTIDQVDAVVAQASPANGQTLEDGSQQGLSAPAKLAGAPADAIFFFRNKGLSAILVESRAMRSGHGPENLAEAKSIVALATSQYGSPRSCIVRSELAALNCIWWAGPIQVAIIYRDFGGGSPALSVLYRPAPDRPHSARFTSRVR